jgi:hypothetical protein
MEQNVRDQVRRTGQEVIHLVATNSIGKSSTKELHNVRMSRFQIRVTEDSNEIKQGNIKVVQIKGELRKFGIE